MSPRLAERRDQRGDGAAERRTIVRPGNGAVRIYEHQPQLGTVRQLGVPVKMSRTPGDPTRPAPAFGEHTVEVLRDAGYSEEEVAAMMESGAAAGPSADDASTFRA